MSHPCIEECAAERNIAALHIERYDLTLCRQVDSGQIEHTGVALQFVHKDTFYALMAGFLEHCHLPGITGTVIIEDKTSRSDWPIIDKGNTMKCPDGTKIAVKYLLRDFSVFRGIIL